MSLKQLRFDGEKPLRLSDMPTNAGDRSDRREELIARTAENDRRAARLQDMLLADGREGIVFAIQARDAAGKDSLVRKGFCCLNPAGLHVTAFKAPSRTEQAHDYLWRIEAALPERGHIAVFNRTQYEDVLAARVHRLETGFRLPQRCLGEDLYARRYRQLRHWEEYLYENGYRMVKLFLNVSKEVQKQRFLDRIRLPEKHWKYAAGDLDERALWDDYSVAFEDAINATATKHAPWYVLPADDKWYTRYLLSELLVKTLEDAAPTYPAPTDTARMAEQAQALENE